MNTGSIPVKQPGSKKIDLIEIGSDLEDNEKTVPKENLEHSQKPALKETTLGDNNDLEDPKTTINTPEMSQETNLEDEKNAEDTETVATNHRK